MPYQEFGRRASGDAVQKQMMIYEMMRKGGVSRGQTEVDKFLEELDKQEKDKTIETRLQRESDEKIIDLGVKQNRLQEKEDFEKWYKGAEARRQEEKNASDLKVDRAQEAASRAAAVQSGASAESARSTAELNKTKNAGEKLENDRKNRDDAVKQARDKINLMTGWIAQGGDIGKDDTEILQNSYRTLFGNPNFTLPRNDDGTYKFDRNKLITYDDKGVPSAGLAKAVNEVSYGYKSPAGKILGDINLAKARNATPEEIDDLVGQFKRATRDSLKDQQAKIVDTLMDNGFVTEGTEMFNKFLDGGKQPKVIVPSQAERQKVRNKVQMLGDLDDIERQYYSLKENGIISVGFLRQPWRVIQTKLGTVDKNVATFVKDLERFKGKYVFDLSGMQTRSNEPEEIQKQIPYFDDSPETFELALPHYKAVLKKQIGYDLAVSKMFGMQIPDEEQYKDVPVADMNAMMRDGEPFHDYVSNDPAGYIPREMIIEKFRGQVLSNKGLERRNADVGGIGMNRKAEEQQRQPAIVPGQSTTSVGTTTKGVATAPSGTPASMVPPTTGAPSPTTSTTNPEDDAIRQRIEERQRKIDKLKAMTGK